MNGLVEQDEKVHLDWLEKSANQNNPRAIDRLGDWFRSCGGNDMEKRLSYHRVAAELGWKESMVSLAFMLERGDGCEQDLRQAVIWGAKGSSGVFLEGVFWDVLKEASRSFEAGTAGDEDCDGVCFALGWGMYWDKYDPNEKSDLLKPLALRCLDYYCSCVQLQQESIFTFLLWWNQTTRVKGPGQMIAQMVWEGREDNLVQTFQTFCNLLCKTFQGKR
jgi:hypothetical protein